MTHFLKQARQIEISEIVERVGHDMEVYEAVWALTYGLENSANEAHKERAWKTFQDRFEYLIIKNKSDIIRESEGA